MSSNLILPTALAALLLSTLACAGPGKATLLAQRNAEMERLGQQTGMPHSWQSHSLKEMRVYSGGPRRPPAQPAAALK